MVESDSSLPGCLYLPVDWRLDIEWKPVHRPDCDPATQVRHRQSGQCISVLGSKDNGSSCTPSQPFTGQPIAIGTGNKWLREEDLKGVGPLRFSRIYNSNPATLSAFIGARWRGTYTQRLDPGTTDGSAWVFRPDGKSYRFVLFDGSYVADGDVVERLSREMGAGGTLSGYRLKTHDDHIEHFDAAGNLLTVTDRAGLVQSLAYDR